MTPDGYPTQQARTEAINAKRAACSHDYVRLVGGSGWHRCRRCGKSTQQP